MGLSGLIPDAIRTNTFANALVRAVRHAAADNLSFIAGGVAFFGFLSIFPAIGIVVSLVGILGDYGALRAEIDRFSDIMPAIAYSLIATQLDSFMNQDQAGFGVGLAISIVVILWSSSRGVDALLHATSVAYGETSDRGFFISVLVAFATTVLGALFLVVALTLIAAIPIFTRFSPIPGTGEQLALLLRWPALLALAVVAFALIYRYALNRRGAKLRWIWPGATLAALVWIAACLLFSLYVEYFGEFEATFGSLAAAVVMLFWMFISAQIFVFGAALNAGLELRTAVDSTIGPDRPTGKRGAYVADNVET